MNLGGGFAGGLAQGYQSQERMRMQQDEQASNLAMRQRQMTLNEQQANMQAEDHQAKMDQLARQKEARDGSAALLKKYYGEQMVEDGAPSQADDGQGGVITIPTMKKVTYKPGEDPKRDADYYNDHLQLVARTSGASMEDMQHVANAVETAKRTAAGKALSQVLSGDEGAMGDFLKHMGKDPKGAKLDFRPVEGVQQIVLADGSTVDLKRAAMANATAEFVKQMQGEEKSAQGAATTKANIAEKQATTNLRGAQAEQEKTLTPVKADEIRAQAASQRAAASEHSANAGLAGDRKKLLQAQTGAASEAGNLSKAKASVAQTKAKEADDDKASRRALTEIKAQAEPAPGSNDGKQKNTDMVAFLAGRAEQYRTSGKTKGTGVAEARKDWDAVAIPAAQWASGLTKLSAKERKAKYGTADIEQIKNEAIKRKLGADSFVAPAPAGKSTDDDTDE
jgi:hypothetical protein